MLPGWSWHFRNRSKEMRKAKTGLLVHFFNHQTHHRGQMHAALAMGGVDPWDTDLFLIMSGL